MILLIILADFFQAEPVRAKSAEPFLADEWVLDAGAEQEQSTAEAENQSGEGVSEVNREIAKIRELISFTKVLSIIIILVLTYFINKYLTLILDNLSEKATNYRLFIKRLAPISRIMIWSFAIYIVIAGVISPPFETIVAIGASVGIAVGFASQDILKNIFGGIIIILDRPFQVGDKIEVAQHYGEVLNIGLRSCRVVTPDDSVVSIPNAELMNTAVSNSNSSALDCQVVAEIYLPATVDIQKVKQIAYKAVYASSYTYLNKPVVVIVLNELENRHFVYKLRVKAYVVDIRFEFLFKSDLTEMIVDECNKLGMIPQPFIDNTMAKPAE
ncbi:mechanosensitive ion channel family protein [Rhodohalobacter sp.]|uniref:mechanosensitive ion channel family protein n=1 Tax=Rhodohalobacter sp. TaxID=1974210 RepID=UPI002ACD39BA|nr:mechanosensitive ion channel domain-containing protein [Rhodohalobacter sp.]